MIREAIIDNMETVL